MLQKIDSAIALYYLAGSTFVFLLVVAIIIYIFLHHKKVNTFRLQLHLEEIKKQQDIFVAINDGEERERTRISEELHDGISAKLSGLNMTLDYLVCNMNDGHDKQLVQKAFAGINEVINELREISHNLMPETISNNDMKILLLNYIEHLNSKTACRYSLYFEGESAKVTKTLKLNCYRIVTELLLNVYKHANATLASAQVVIGADKIELIVEDNGHGFLKSLDGKPGIGLVSITNRITESNGTINIDSSAKGTTVIVEMPLTICV